MTRTRPVPSKGETEYVTVIEAARLLGFPVRTITRWVNDGRLPYVVIEGNKLLARHDVDALVQGPTNCEDG